MTRGIWTKWIVGGIVLLIIVAGACFLWYRHDTAAGRKAAAAADKVLQQWKTDKVKTPRTAKPESTEPPAESKTQSTDRSITKTTDGVKSPQTSSNPMFAGGVPKHLQCPEQWIGMYSREIKADSYELTRINGPRVDEILSKYNPHRPITEVWPLFIAAEKSYYANADPERSDPGQGGGRFDWAYQNLLDFPEVFVLGNIDTERYATMRQVAIGRWDPDLNLHILQDGREFRAKTGYNYEEIAERTGVNAKGQIAGTRTSIGFGHSGRDAEIVKIYLAETSDEELEQLGGWNYNIDPYATGIYRLPDDATERVLEMIRNAYGGLKK